MGLTNAILSDVFSTEHEYCPKEHRDILDVHVFLQRQINYRNLSKKNLLISIDIPESVGYKYINGTRAMSRDTFLKFLLAFDLNFKQVQLALLNFGYGGLNIKNKRDSAIIHAIVNNYTYLQLKNYLQKHNIRKL